MLGSAFHCVTKIGALMLATAMLTACGGGGAGSEAPAAVISQTSLSVEASSTPATPPNIERSSAANINLTLSSSSVGKLTDNPTIASSSVNAISSSSKADSKSSSLNAVAVNSTATVTISSAAPTSSLAAKSTSSAASNKNTSSAASRSSSNVTSSSSNKASSSKASSISSKASSKTSSASSKASSSSSAATKLGATITWSHPTAREDGSYLTLDEIGGYKIRFKAISASADTFIYVSLPGTNITSYKFPSSALGLEFEIAVYDSHGLYSEYVHIYSN